MWVKVWSCHCLLSGSPLCCLDRAHPRLPRLSSCPYLVSPARLCLTYDLGAHKKMTSALTSAEIWIAIRALTYERNIRSFRLQTRKTGFRGYVTSWWVEAWPRFLTTRTYPCIKGILRQGENYVNDCSTQFNPEILNAFLKMLFNGKWLHPRPFPQSFWFLTSSLLSQVMKIRDYQSCGSCNS